MALEQVLQHPEEAVLKLIAPFEGKPRIASLLTAFILEIQLIEDTIWDLLEQRDIDSADLTRLKILGKIVGQAQLGFTTEEFRLMIRARAAANASFGRMDNLLDVLELLFGPGNFSIAELGNATLLLIADDQVDNPSLATFILPDVRAAGIQLFFAFQLDADVTQPFVWDDFATSAGTPTWSVRVT